MYARRPSKKIYIGGVAVGGDAPVSVQSMTKTDTRDAAATVYQIEGLASIGCELVRVAVPDMEAAESLRAITRSSPIPVIADIHFDHRLALQALACGVQGLRLNPGNIRRREHVRAVVKAARERGVPIRIGVNVGSLPPQTEGAVEVAVGEHATVVDRMLEAALGHVRILEELDFDLIKVSLKCFDVPTTVEAYQRMGELVPYPLHLGITEAGRAWAGAIRSAAGIGILLHMGIGDTIRVSLSASPEEEVEAGYEILKCLNLRQRGPTLVSCPTCGRSEVHLLPLVQEVEERLRALQLPLRVAVMGCGVNGPGEARDADVGVAAGRGKGLIFRKGQVVRTVPEAEIADALWQEIEAWRAEQTS